MMQTQEKLTNIEPYSASLRALCSLSRQDADALQAAVILAGGGWTVEQHDDYEGFRSVLLTRESGQEGSGFLISGRKGAVEVAMLCGDEMRPLGAFASVAAATPLLASALEAADATGGKQIAPPRRAAAEAGIRVPPLRVRPVR